MFLTYDREPGTLAAIAIECDQAARLHVAHKSGVASRGVGEHCINVSQLPIVGPRPVALVRMSKHPLAASVQILASRVADEIDQAAGAREVVRHRDTALLEGCQL